VSSFLTAHQHKIGHWVPRRCEKSEQSSRNFIWTLQGW